MNKELNNLAEELKGKLKTIEASKNKMFEGLSPKAQQRVKGPQMDYTKAMRAINNGNFEELYNLVK